MLQVDGNASFISSDSDNSDDDTIIDTDDEVDSQPIPANFFPVPDQIVLPGQPLQFDVNLSTDNKSSFIPLCLVMNCRSACNKANNLKEMMQTIGPDLILASETWERDKMRLRDILNCKKFKIKSFYRKSKSPGGGCAIIYNESRFTFTDPDICVPEGVEAVWSVFTPVAGCTQHLKVKRIAVASIYVSPRSKYKSETISHIIETIHMLRATYDNQISVLISGDFNRIDITDILECYGGLRQIISVPTRQSATLEIVLTDLQSMFHPPTTLPPLQVDTDKKGKDSDHNIVLLAPKSSAQFRVERKKKIIKTRPLLDSNILRFEKDLGLVQWDVVFEDKNPDEQAKVFHTFLRNQLDRYFPEKTTTITNLDRIWMSPPLKQLHRQMQREHHLHRKSPKYKKLKSKFKKKKRKAIKAFYSEFVTELKLSNPGKWYAMAKKIGATDLINEGETQVESLSEFSNLQSAHKIAEHFAAISNEYLPIDNSQLPCYLPAPPPPQVEEYQVYERLTKTKKTRSTLPLDIPDRLRQECSPLLAGPLTTIINNCLSQSVYPAEWKQEWITPVQKVTHPKVISDLRKISCTSDYSKLFEVFLKDWVMEDICKNLDIGQFGGQPGIGTEHMIVCMLDRILKLLDRHPDRSAIIMSLLDWSAAFDRQDPTLAIKKFIQLGVRPSLIPLLASYLTDRQMAVKFNGEMSDFLTLVGGGPQGTLLGQIEYLVQSNDNADIVPPEDRYKYIDDLSILHLVCMSSLLTEYDFHQHVASDIATDSLYLPPDSYGTQDSLNFITNWTRENLMTLNEKKCSYMTFSRSDTSFSTRLQVNNHNLEKITETKLLGVWLNEDLTWAKNCTEICKKAFARLSMLTKLKYVGVCTEDLIEIYILYIRSLTEYCSVAWHSGLTQMQSDKIERIQKTCLKVILGEMYVSYEAALEMCGIESLSSRRQKRCLDFSLKCIKHPKNSRIFPLNTKMHGQNVKSKELFEVNWARTSTYRMSAVPFCQRLLNTHFSSK